ncbi:hypothetical protein IHE45_13G065200 [Dioscorea alata]|uniref:Uncharacterized protein n=1 Tax=Dioscorea alata TaxID=55571 RepID=A0ACB7UYL9_DIOAL|nr:hypothetical protein IHE45_13G065200 [Dioscorea alata]
MYPGLPSRLEKEILDRYLEVVLKGNKDGLKKLHLWIGPSEEKAHGVPGGCSTCWDHEGCTGLLDNPGRLPGRGSRLFK